jgi:hypothetical protein
MFVGEIDPFPTLASASPRLLFDFSSRFDELLGLRKDPHEKPQSLFYFGVLFLMGIGRAAPSH